VSVQREEIFERIKGEDAAGDAPPQRAATSGADH